MKTRSSIEEHKYIKGGVIQAPLNKLQLTLGSWSKDRLPEYLWLGLILRFYGREDAFKRLVKILNEISINVSELKELKLSQIFLLPSEKQHILYQIISSYIDKEVLSPLTSIYMEPQYEIFNEYFYCSKLKLSNKIIVLADAVKFFYNHQSHETTDLKFCVMLLAILRGKIIFNSKCHNAIEAVTQYAELSHSDERMRKFRAFIRATEQMVSFSPVNDNFNYSFWKELGMKTECKPICINYDIEDITMHKEAIKGYTYRLNYLIRTYKENLLLESKFDVLLGLSIYALKLYNEIVEHNLGNSIVGRNALRTIIESYVTMKYLLKLESNSPDIWETYKLYGIGKYKSLILIKDKNGISDLSCFNERFIDLIINEIKWEEFVDIDTTYFDKKKIKDKFKDVEEEELYDLAYEYNTNFVHAFWGSIRESSMISCNSAAHQYHLIPDVNLDVKLSPVYDDVNQILEKIFCLVDKEYPSYNKEELSIDRGS